MKKKILISLIAILSLCTFNINVKAAEVCAPVSPTISVYVPSGRVNVYINGVGKRAIFFQQYVNGKPALCLNRGGDSSSKYSFKSSQKLSSYSNKIVQDNLNRTYNFLMVSPNNNIRYIVAQVATWTVIEGDGKLNINRLRENVISTYCALYYKGQDAYNQINGKNNQV